MMNAKFCQQRLRLCQQNRLVKTILKMPTKPYSHRAMFKLGGKNVFVLCLLVKNVSAANSADRCNFKESEKVAQDLNRIGGDISSD